jgi:hypothetical protein
MRINTLTRLGLIFLILGTVLLFSIWTSPVVQSIKAGIGTVDPGETFAYGLFMSPVGLGNLVVEGDTLMAPPPSKSELANPNPDGSIHVDAPVIRVEYEVFAHLVVVSPSGVILVDVEVATPYTVPIGFTERGEYVVYVTNLGDETVPIPISVKFPKDSGVVNREADKFFVSIVLTVSGVALFCLGLSTSLILKHKNS